MPYKRIGKIVYKKVGGKWVRKGASSSPEKAEAYMRALYANEK